MGGEFGSDSALVCTSYQVHHFNSPTWRRGGFPGVSGERRVLAGLHASGCRCAACAEGMALPMLAEV